MSRSSAPPPGVLPRATRRGFLRLAAASAALTALGQLRTLEALDRPVLVGPSRKSFIGKLLDRPVGDRRMGTAAAVAAAILLGAHIVRVHDVREMVEVARVSDAILNAGGPA